jgi:hypothetical protein
MRRAFFGSVGPPSLLFGFQRGGGAIHGAVFHACAQNTKYILYITHTGRGGVYHEQRRGEGLYLLLLFVDSALSSSLMRQSSREG